MLCRSAFRSSRLARLRDLWPSALVPVVLDLRVLRMNSTAAVEETNTVGLSSMPFATTRSTKSNRQAFREIPLNVKQLRHLDSINLGYLGKRRSRVAVAKRLDPRNQTKDKKINNRETVKPTRPRPVPFPFRARGKLECRAARFEQVPNVIRGEPPEVALIGRSNVGKSTLMNALIGFDNSYVQKAKISEKPGETTTLSFFRIGSRMNKRFHHPSSPLTADGASQTADSPDRTGSHSRKVPALLLVDMPGYGFAHMKEDEKLRCHELCLDYLTSNPHRNKVLKRVVLLLDGRHGIKATDIHFLQYLQNRLIENLGLTGEEEEEGKEGEGSARQSGISKSSNLVKSEDSIPLVPSVAFPYKTIRRLSRELGWKLQLVLTKGDLVERSELCRRMARTSDLLQANVPVLFHSMLPVIAVSSVQRRGIIDLQRAIAAVIPPPPSHYPLST